MGWNEGDGIGRYEVRGRLGAGGFATVLLAYDPVLDAPVAIKVLADNLSLDPDVRGRFIQEARVLRGLRSERLVTVYDIGELPGGQPYLVMELARRGTLAARCAALGRPPQPDEVLRVVDDLAAALRVVHAAGVVHRDLKPSNLLLQADDDRSVDDVLMADDETLVLGDFGMAKVLGADSLRLTVQGGTAGYMAPEQRQPFSPIDQRADLYAATALVVELLTGRTPLLDPEAVHSPALRCGLALDPDDRFPTVDAWHEAMRADVEARRPAPFPPLPYEPAEPRATASASDQAWPDDTVAAGAGWSPVRGATGLAGPGWSPVADDAGAAGPGWSPVPGDAGVAGPGWSPVPALPPNAPAPPVPPVRRRRFRLLVAAAAAVVILAAFVVVPRLRGAGDPSISGPSQLTVGSVGAYVTDADEGDQVVWTGPDGEERSAVLQVRPTGPGRLRLEAEVRPADGPVRRGRITVEVVADDDADAGIVGPALVTVGQLATLTADLPDGLRATWTAWDGEEHTGDRLSLRPTDTGLLEVELRAEGAEGRVHRARHTITVVDR